MKLTTDRMTRLLTEQWNLLHAHEKREALFLTRQLARQFATRPTPPVWAADTWAYTFGHAIGEVLGDAAAMAWNEATHPDHLEMENGLDAREAAFYASAVEARLRRQSAPRAAARGLLRRAGARTVNARSRLATA